MEVHFVIERSTSGALLYKEVNQLGRPIDSPRDGMIGSLYIRKTSEVGKQAPKKIVVTISAEE